MITGEIATARERPPLPHISTYKYDEIRRTDPTIAIPQHLDQHGGLFVLPGIMDNVALWMLARQTNRHTSADDSKEAALSFMQGLQLACFLAIPRLPSTVVPTLPLDQITARGVPDFSAWASEEFWNIVMPESPECTDFQEWASVIDTGDGKSSALWQGYMTGVVLLREDDRKRRSERIELNNALEAKEAFEVLVSGMKKERAQQKRRFLAIMRHGVGLSVLTDMEQRSTYPALVARMLKLSGVSTHQEQAILLDAELDTAAPTRQPRRRRRR